MNADDVLSLKVRQAKARIHDVVRTAVVIAAQGVIVNSPVLTGRLRASWNLGAGVPDPSTSEAVDKGGNATLTQIATAVRQYDAGGLLYVTTPLSYARPIEYEGHSKKAPQGMVGITMANLPNALRQYVKESSQ